MEQNNTEIILIILSQLTILRLCFNWLRNHVNKNI